MTVKPRRLARRMSSCAAARTWLTVPGALSSVSRYMVWIESMTTICGRSSRSSVAAMSRMLVAVASSTGAASAGAEPLRHRLARRLLDQAVPRQAALAAPDPFGMHGAAFLADEAGLRARHVSCAFSPLPLRERKGPIAKRWEGEGCGAAARLVFVSTPHPNPLP